MANLLTLKNFETCILVEGTTELCRTSKLSINTKDKDNYCINKPENIRRVWKCCYFGCSRSPDVDEIKIFDEDGQVTEHCTFI